MVGLAPPLSTQILEGSILCSSYACSDSAHSVAGDCLTFPPCSVANQLKTFAPVGIARVIAADVKKAQVSKSKPTANMWWTQSKTKS